MVINAGIKTVIIRDTIDEYRVIDVDSEWVLNDESLEGLFNYWLPSESRFPPGQMRLCEYPNVKTAKAVFFVEENHLAQYFPNLSEILHIVNMDKTLCVMSTECK